MITKSLSTLTKSNLDFLSHYISPYLLYNGICYLNVQCSWHLFNCHNALNHSTFIVLAINLEKFNIYDRHQIGRSFLELNVSVWKIEYQNYSRQKHETKHTKPKTTKSIKTKQKKESLEYGCWKVYKKHYNEMLNEDEDEEKKNESFLCHQTLFFFWLSIVDSTI